MHSEQEYPSFKYTRDTSDRPQNTEDSSNNFD
jgi:hypothetical protein